MSLAGWDGLTIKDIPDTDLVIMIYEKSGSAYVKTTKPWMYGYPVRGTTGNNHWYYTRFFTADPATILNANGTYPTANAAQVVDHYDYLDGSAHLKYAKGLIYGTAAEMNALTYAEIARNYVVKLDLIPVNGLPDSDGDGYKDYGGVKLTTVNQRALYAGETHPLSVNIQSRWGVATPGVTKVSGWGVAMSALKRFTNMSVCWACHTSSKAEQLKNTDSYSYPDDPRGLPETEGKYNWPS